MTKTAVDGITHRQYLQLLGLRLLADRISCRMKEIVSEAVAITGERDDDDGSISEYGHTSDCIWGGRDVDEMLRLLKITVGEHDQQQA